MIGINPWRCVSSCRPGDVGEGPPAALEANRPWWSPGIRMRRTRYSFAFFAGLAMFLPSVQGSGEPQDISGPRIKPPGSIGKEPAQNPKSGDQLVKVRVVADAASVSPGQTFNLAFIFDIEPGWHIYWQNPGASGGPTEVKVSGPQGFTIGKPRFPR